MGLFNALAEAVSNAAEAISNAFGGGGSDSSSSSSDSSPSVGLGGGGGGTVNGSYGNGSGGEKVAGAGAKKANVGKAYNGGTVSTGGGTSGGTNGSYVNVDTSSGGGITNPFFGGGIHSEVANNNYQDALNARDNYIAQNSGFADNDYARYEYEQGLAKYDQRVAEAEKAKNMFTPNYSPNYKTSDELNGTSPEDARAAAQRAADIANQRGQSRTNYLKTYMTEDSNWTSSKYLTPEPTTPAKQSQAGDSFSRALENQQKPNDNIFAQDYAQMQADIAAEPPDPNKPYEKDYEYATRDELLDMDRNDSWSPTSSPKKELYPWEKPDQVHADDSAYWNTRGDLPSAENPLFPGGRLQSEEGGYVAPGIQKAADAVKDFGNAVGAVTNFAQADLHDDMSADSAVQGGRAIDAILKNDFDIYMGYAESSEDWDAAYKKAIEDITEVAIATYGDTGVAEQIIAKINAAQEQYKQVIGNKSLTPQQAQQQIGNIQAQLSDATGIQLPNVYPNQTKADEYRAQGNAMSPGRVQNPEFTSEQQQLADEILKRIQTTDDKDLKELAKKALGVEFEDNAYGAMGASHMSGNINEYANQLAYELTKMSPDDKDFDKKMKDLDTYTMLLSYVSSVNQDALETEGFVEGMLAGNAAYLPQLREQTESRAPWLIGAGLVGAAIGGVPGFTTAIKVANILGSVPYSYESMYGAAFRNMLYADNSVNLSFDQMKSMAQDEAILSSIVEFGDTFTDTLVRFPGAGKILRGFGGSKAAKTVFGQVLKFAGASIESAAGEYGEEGLQEIISIANQRRAAGGGENGPESGLWGLAKEFVDVASGMVSSIANGEGSSNEQLKQVHEAGMGGAYIGLPGAAVGGAVNNLITAPARSGALQFINNLDKNKTRAGIYEGVINGTTSEENAKEFNKIAHGKGEDEFKAGLDAFEKHDENNNFKGVKKGYILLDGDNNPVGTVTKANGKTVTIELTGENGKKTTENINIVGLHGYLDSASKTNQILDDGGQIVSAEVAEDAAAYKADEKARQEAAEARRQEIIQKAEENRKAQEEAKAAAAKAAKPTDDSGTGTVKAAQPKADNPAPKPQPKPAGANMTPEQRLESLKNSYNMLLNTGASKATLDSVQNEITALEQQIAAAQPAPAEEKAPSTPKAESSNEARPLADIEKDIAATKSAMQDAQLNGDQAEYNRLYEKLRSLTRERTAHPENVAKRQAEAKADNEAYEKEHAEHERKRKEEEAEFEKSIAGLSEEDKRKARNEWNQERSYNQRTSDERKALDKQKYEEHKDQIESLKDGDILYNSYGEPFTEVVVTGDKRYQFWQLDDNGKRTGYFSTAHDGHFEQGSKFDIVFEFDKDSELTGGLTTEKPPSQPSSPIADRNDTAKSVQDFVGSTKKDGAFKEFEVNGVKYKVVYDAKKQSYTLRAKKTNKDGTESKNYHVLPGTNALSAEGLLNYVSKLNPSQKAPESPVSASPETDKSIPESDQKSADKANEKLNTGFSRLSEMSDDELDKFEDDLHDAFSKIRRDDNGNPVAEDAERAKQLSAMEEALLNEQQKRLGSEKSDEKSEKKSDEVKEEPKTEEPKAEEKPKTNAPVMTGEELNTLNAIRKNIKNRSEQAIKDNLEKASSDESKQKYSEEFLRQLKKICKEELDRRAEQTKPVTIDKKENRYLSPSTNDGVRYNNGRYRSAREAYEAAVKGRDLTHDQKVEIMKEILRDKFTRGTNREKLLATGDREIVLDNGLDNTVDGTNDIGKIIMDIRAEIVAQDKENAQKAQERAAEKAKQPKKNEPKTPNPIATATDQKRQEERNKAFEAKKNEKKSIWQTLNKIIRGGKSYDAVAEEDQPDSKLWQTIYDNAKILNVTREEGEKFTDFINRVYQQLGVATNIDKFFGLGNRSSETTEVDIDSEEETDRTTWQIDQAYNTANQGSEDDGRLFGKRRPSVHGSLDDALRSGNIESYTEARLAEAKKALSDFERKLQERNAKNPKRKESVNEKSYHNILKQNVENFEEKLRVVKRHSLYEDFISLISSFSTDNEANIPEMESHNGTIINPTIYQVWEYIHGRGRVSTTVNYEDSLFTRPISPELEAALKEVTGKDDVYNVRVSDLLDIDQSSDFWKEFVDGIDDTSNIAGQLTEEQRLATYAIRDAIDELALRGKVGIREETGVAYTPEETDPFFMLPEFANQQGEILNDDQIAAYNKLSEDDKELAERVKNVIDYESEADAAGRQHISYDWQSLNSIMQNPLYNNRGLDIARDEVPALIHVLEAIIPNQHGGGTLEYRTEVNDQGLLTIRQAKIGVDTRTILDKLSGGKAYAQRAKRLAQELLKKGHVDAEGTDYNNPARRNSSIIHDIINSKEFGKRVQKERAKITDPKELERFDKAIEKTRQSGYFDGNETYYSYRGVRNLMLDTGIKQLAEVYSEAVKNYINGFTDLDGEQHAGAIAEQTAKLEQLQRKAENIRNSKKFMDNWLVNNDKLDKVNAQIAEVEKDIENLNKWLEIVDSYDITVFDAAMDDFGREIFGDPYEEDSFAHAFKNMTIKGMLNAETYENTAELVDWLNQQKKEDKYRYEQGEFTGSKRYTAENGAPLFVSPVPGGQDIWWFPYAEAGEPNVYEGRILGNPGGIYTSTADSVEDPNGAKVYTDADAVYYPGGKLTWHDPVETSWKPIGRFTEATIKKRWGTPKPVKPRSADSANTSKVGGTGQSVSPETNASGLQTGGESQSTRSQGAPGKTSRYAEDSSYFENRPELVDLSRSLAEAKGKGTLRDGRTLGKRVIQKAIEKTVKNTTSQGEAEAVLRAAGYTVERHNGVTVVSANTKSYTLNTAAAAFGLSKDQFKYSRFFRKLDKLYKTATMRLTVQGAAEKAVDSRFIPTLYITTNISTLEYDSNGNTYIENKEGYYAQTEDGNSFVLYARSYPDTVHEINHDDVFHAAGVDDDIDIKLNVRLDEAAAAAKISPEQLAAVKDYLVNELNYVGGSVDEEIFAEVNAVGETGTKSSWDSKTNNINFTEFAQKLYATNEWQNLVDDVRGNADKESRRRAREARGRLPNAPTNPLDSNYKLNFRDEKSKQEYVKKVEEAFKLFSESTKRDESPRKGGNGVTITNKAKFLQARQILRDAEKLLLPNGDMLSGNTLARRNANNDVVDTLITNIKDIILGTNSHTITEASSSTEESTPANPLYNISSSSDYENSKLGRIPALMQHTAYEVDVSQELQDMYSALFGNEETQEEYWEEGNVNARRSEYEQSDYYKQRNPNATEETNEEAEMPVFDYASLKAMARAREKRSRGNKSKNMLEEDDFSVNNMSEEELAQRERESLYQEMSREPEFYDAQEEKEFREALERTYRETDQITLGDKIHEVRWTDKDGKEHVRRFTTEGLAAAARAGGIASNERQREQNQIDSELYENDEAMQEARESLEQNRGEARRTTQKDVYGVGTERVQATQKRLNRDKPRSAFFNSRIYYRQHGKTNASMRNFKNVSQLGGHVSALLDGKISFRSFNDYAESNTETPIVGVILDERMRKELSRVAALEEAARNASSTDERAVTDYQYAAARAAAHLVARMDMVEKTERAKSNFDKLAKESGKSGNRNKLQNAMDWRMRMQISGDNFWRMMGNWDKNGNNEGYSYADDHNRSIAARISEEAKLKNCFADVFAREKIDTNSREFQDFISGETMSKVKIEGHEISLMEAIKLKKIMDTLNEYDRVENKPDYTRLAYLDGFCFKDKNGQSVFIDIPGGFRADESTGIEEVSRESWLSDLSIALMNEIFNNKIADAYYYATNRMYQLASEDANKVFAKVNGYERYMYKYAQYTDIHYARKNTHDIDFDYQNTDVTDVDDTASMKDRSRDAGGYIMVTPMSKSVDAYISQISNYIAFEEFGQRLNVLQNGLMSDGSLNRTIRETYGDQFDQWFDNYVKSMTLYKDRGKEMSKWDKGLQDARRLMMSGALVASVSVPFKQVSSFFDTFGSLDPRAVRKAFLTNPAGRRVKGINNYLYQARQNTISDPDYAELFGEKGLFSKARNVPILKNLVDLATKGTNMMDVNTVSNVYKACVYDVEMNTLPAERLYKNGKNFKEGLTAEGQFYVDSKFEQALLGSQPIFTPQARNELARTDDQFLKMFQTFRTQQTQNYNRTLQAMNEWKAAEKGDKGEAFKTLQQTVRGHIAASASLSLLTVASAALLHKHRRYKDDDDELDDEKLGKKFLYGMIESMAGNYLFVGDFAKWMIDLYNSQTDENWDWKYSSKESQYMDIGKAHIPIVSSGAVGTALQALNSVIHLCADVAQNGWDETNILSARYVAGNMATAFGAPINNIYTAMNGVYQWTMDGLYKITGDKKYEKKYDDFLTQLIRVDMSRQNRLVSAIMNENQNKIDDFFENMGEDAFQRAVMYGALDRYKEGKINEQEWLEMLMNFGGKSYKDASNEVQKKKALIDSGISQYNGIDGRDGRAKFYETYSNRFQSREAYKQFFTDVKNGKRDGKHNTYYTTYNKQQQEVSANQSSIIDRLNENIRAGNITYDTAKLLWEKYYGYSSSKWSAWQYVGK